MKTILPETISFLQKLAVNNNRDWFQEHKNDYKNVQNNVKAFSEELMEVMKSHDAIEKFKIFRIYRDVRFSKNKLPYKTHIGIVFTRATARLRGSYYLHIDAEKSFLAGGFWEPSKEDLFRIRKEFEMDSTEIQAIEKDPTFQQFFTNIEGDELVSAPRGFDKNDPNIRYIRKKQFYVMKSFTTQEVLATDFLSTVDKAFKAMRPFLNLMSEILTTNLNGESILEE